jgi:large repetitive protein
VIKVEVYATDGNGGSSPTRSDQVTVGNTAPTLTSVTITPASPGTNSVLTATPNGFADADGDTATYHFQWFKNGTALAGETGSTLDLGAAGNGNRDDVIKVEVYATDGNGGSSPTRSDQVTVGNTAPTLTITGAATANEGQLKHYEFSSSDPDTESFSLTAASCGAHGVRTGLTFDSGTGSGSFDCTYKDGPKASVVEARVTDSRGAASNAPSISVQVANLAPTVGTPALVVNPVTGIATANSTFVDPGVEDTHTGTFLWTINGALDAASTPAAVTESAGSGSAAGTRKLSPGCYTISVKATVTDNDGASTESLSSPIASSLDVYSAQFRSPIKDGERNLVKYGNVVPVKVILYSGCVIGQTDNSRDLFVQLTSGGDGDPLTWTNAVTESVSSADTGQKMRIADGGYIYNLSTRGLDAKKDYSIRIRLGAADYPAPAIISATLSNNK